MNASEPTVPADSSRPILSFIITARNDAYMGDFKWRFRTTCDMIARNLAAIGRPGRMEIIVCDWNSDVPMHREMVLSPLARDIVRFIVVPPHVAVPAQKDSTFPNCIINNVGIRRARGEFLALTNADIMFTPATLLMLLAVLEGTIPGVPIRQSVMEAGRRQLPVSHVMRSPPYFELDEYISRNAGLFPLEGQHLGSAAPADLLVMHRDVWFECGGVDERFIYWGWMDVDLVMRVTQRYPLVPLANYGISVIHLEHYTEKRNYDPKSFHRRVNRSVDNPQFRVNDDNWGLASHEFETFQAEQVAEIGDWPSIAPGTIETWAATADKISADLGSQPVSELVNLVLQNCQGLVAQHEVNALRALAWFSLARRPRCFVDAGMRYPPAAALVARGSPGVEIYGLVNWERPGADEAMFQNRDDSCLKFLASNTIRGLGQQWAYTRFVGGDPATAVQRLASSALGRFQVELALIRADAPAAVDQALELSQYLRPGGAFVICSPDAERYHAVHQALRGRYPPFLSLNFDDGRSGLLIAARFQA